MHKPLYTLLALLTSVTLAYGKTVVIDVRTPAEFAQDHVPQAINIEHTTIEQRIGEAKVNKDDTVILYCRSGRRSGIAQETLQRLGYTRVENYGSLDAARQKLQKQ